MSAPTVIIQRVIPDYRVPLFRALHERFGWRVACAATPPGSTFLNVADQRHDFADYFDCDFPDPANQYACQFPLEAIIEKMRPVRVIAEFSMTNNLARGLPGLRKAGSIRSFALWTHGWNMARGFSNPADVAWQFARLLPMARADLLLAYTGEGRDWLQKWLPFKKVIALGNTLDVEAIRDVASGAVAVRHGDPQLLSVGRLNAEKKFVELIALFGELKARFPNAALTIIGDGPERAEVDQAAGRFADGSVKVLGAIHDEASLAPHFKGADFFILSGAAGLSVNHALAYDVPVIAYARGRGLPFNGPELAYIVEGVTGFLCHSPGQSPMLEVLSAAISKDRAAVMRPLIRQYMDAHGRIASVVSQFAVADTAF